MALHKSIKKEDKAIFVHNINLLPFSPIWVVERKMKLFPNIAIAAIQTFLISQIIVICSQQILKEIAEGAIIWLKWLIVTATKEWQFLQKDAI